MSNLSKREIIRKIKANGKKKKMNILARAYRMLCFIGLRIQFITYNKRRRIRKFFSPVGGRIAGFLSRHVAQPTAGAWNEFRCICGEIKAKAGVGATFSRHRGFFAGVVNVVLPLICIGALTAVISAVMSLPHALEVTCNGKSLGYIEDESVYNNAVELLSQRTVNTNNGYIESLTPKYSILRRRQELRRYSVHHGDLPRSVQDRHPRRKGQLHGYDRHHKRPVFHRQDRVVR